MKRVLLLMVLVLLVGCQREEAKVNVNNLDQADKELQVQVDLEVDQDTSPQDSVDDISEDEGGEESSNTQDSEDDISEDEEDDESSNTQNLVVDPAKLIDRPLFVEGWDITFENLIDSSSPYRVYMGDDLVEDSVIHLTAGTYPVRVIAYQGETEAETLEFDLIVVTPDNPDYLLVYDEPGGGMIDVISKDQVEIYDKEARTLWVEDGLLSCWLELTASGGKTFYQKSELDMLNETYNYQAYAFYWQGEKSIHLDMGFDRMHINDLLVDKGLLTIETGDNRSLAVNLKDKSTWNMGKLYIEGNRILSYHAYKPDGPMNTFSLMLYELGDEGLIDLFSFRMRTYGLEDVVWQGPNQLVFNRYVHYDNPTDPVADNEVKVKNVITLKDDDWVMSTLPDESLEGFDDQVILYDSLSLSGETHTVDKGHITSVTFANRLAVIDGHLYLWFKMVDQEGKEAYALRPKGPDEWLIFNHDETIQVDDGYGQVIEVSNKYFFETYYLLDDSLVNQGYFTVYWLDWLGVSGSLFRLSDHEKIGISDYIFLNDQKNRFVVIDDYYKSSVTDIMVYQVNDQGIIPEFIYRTYQWRVDDMLWLGPGQLEFDKVYFEEQEESVRGTLTYDDDQWLLGNESLPDPAVITSDLLVGVWQDGPAVGSGYGEMYHFNADGTYKRQMSQYDYSGRILTDFGTYRVEAGILYLHINKQLTKVGGRLVEEGAPNYGIHLVDYEEEMIDVDIKIEYPLTGPFDGGGWPTCLYLDDQTYFKLSPNPDTY